MHVNGKKLNNGAICTKLLKLTTKHIQFLGECIKTINFLVHSFINSFLLSSFFLWPVLRKVHSLVQSEFYTEGDLVLPFSIPSILSSP